jgi:hypothetical protein
LKDLVAKIPPEKMERCVIGFGEITFSANEFVAHAEIITEEGNQFLDSINAMTFEILKMMSTL